MFIVVQVHTDYDYIEDVIYIKTFTSSQEGYEYIKSLKQQYQNAWLILEKYIQDWVKNFCLGGCITNQELLEYLGWTLPKFNKNRLINLGNIKDILLNDLKAMIHNPPSWPNYNPPKLTENNGYNMFVIEVPEK